MTPSWDGGNKRMSVQQPLSAVVVAHPDDEALWLSSVVASVERIVFGFGAISDKPHRSEARRSAVAALPLRGIVNLAIAESGVAWQSYLAGPQLTPWGVRIFEPAVWERYKSNHAKLVEGLRPALAGCENVYTHNPWGEYGHAEHIQVYRAVTALQDELGYTVWYSNYVGPRNWTFVSGLAQRLNWARRCVMRPDIVTARALMQVYRHYGAWTWKSGHRWPAQEILYAQPPSGSPDLLHVLSGESLLDVGRLGWWRPPWRSPWRRLPRSDEAPGHTAHV
jgi:LmbE family N-acetylglucosaminyl deacetylase